MQNENITIKLQFNEDLRRIKVPANISFTELIELSKSLFKQVPANNWENLTMKYLDNEEDMCNVTSELEFRESFHAKKHEVLKLELTCRKKPFPAQVIAQEQPQQPQQPQQDKRVCWPERITQQRLRLAGFQDEGILLMQEKKFEEAKAAFQKQAELIRCPWRKSVPIYNIACCEALLGNTDSALAQLAQAIKLGYSDVNHIEKDEDFLSLRELEAFKTMVKELRDKPAKPAKKVNNTQDEPERKKFGGFQFLFKDQPELREKFQSLKQDPTKKEEFFEFRNQLKQQAMQRRQTEPALNIKPDEQPADKQPADKQPADKQPVDKQAKAEMRKQFQIKMQELRADPETKEKIQEIKQNPEMKKEQLKEFRKELRQRTLAELAKPEVVELPKPEPTKETSVDEVKPIKRQYETECNTLVQMGFTDTEMNFKVLAENKGNVTRAVGSLLR